MPGLRITHTYNLIHDRRHTLQFTLLGKQCEAQPAIYELAPGPGSQFSQPSTSQCCQLLQVAPGQAVGVTKSWEAHVKEVLLLLSSPCLQAIWHAQQHPSCASLCCIPGVPKKVEQEAVGPQLVEGRSS